MAINVTFNGTSIYKPGFFGDPYPRHTQLRMFLRKLNIYPRSY